MPTSTNVTNLKINELTEAQFDSAVQGGVIGANEISILTDMDEAIQVDTMPTAGADELGKVYQFIGTTDANYTHGYFYECVSDGQTPATYSWENIEVQDADTLPSQSGQNGKFLTTNGTDASWSNEIPSIVLKGNHNYTFDSFANLLRVRHTYNNITNELFVADKDGNVQYPKHGILGYNGNYLSKVVTQKIGRSDYATTDITIPSVAGSMAVQVATMPTANSTREGQIYQFTGATDSTYTNGRFYKCVSDGQSTPTYSWEEVSMGGGSSYTAGTGIDITSGVISVTNPTLQNNATGSNSVVVGRSDTSNHPTNTVVIGGGSGTQSAFSVAIGHNSSTNTSSSIAVGASTFAMNQAVAIGFNANAKKSIQISCGTSSSTTNSDANTFKVGNENGNFEIMSADGTIPTDRLVHAINKYSTMPTAASTNEGWIVQFTGTTDSTYTHGHLYECVSDGGNPATYSWTEVQLGGGGSSYTAGTGIDITGGVISVTAPTLTNVATGNGSLTIGGIATTKQQCINIGLGAMATANYTIQIGNGTNSTAGTMSVGLFSNTWRNYRLLDSDGTIPTDRLTKVNSTITLTSAGWSSNTQTVTVNGVTSTSVVLVAPDPSDTADYVAAGILCTSQATNSLTFTATTTPTTDIDVNIVCL